LQLGHITIILELSSRSQNELENGFIQYCFDDVEALQLGHITMILESSSMSQNELENGFIQYCFDDVEALQLGHITIILEFSSMSQNELETDSFNIVLMTSKLCSWVISQLFRSFPV
jgi:hypothetical protein